MRDDYEKDAHDRWVYLLLRTFIVALVVGPGLILLGVGKLMMLHKHDVRGLATQAVVVQKDQRTVQYGTSSAESKYVYDITFEFPLRDGTPHRVKYTTENLSEYAKYRGKASFPIRYLPEKPDEILLGASTTVPRLLAWGSIATGAFLLGVIGLMGVVQMASLRSASRTAPQRRRR
jgi:hypothetical protein